MAREFRSWVERPLRALAETPPNGAARLTATAPLELADLSNPAATAQGGAPFELLGPGDVVRLASGAITRRYPAPGAVDAEETKAALVELRPEDLPWRYTPEKRVGEKLRPWLALVVGPRRADELTLTADGRVGIGPAAQLAQPLVDSWRCAHVHVVEGTPIARILCLRDLDAQTDYTACLVPAFVVERDGRRRDAWPHPGGGTAWLPCYDSWSFRTGEEGDFPQLAGLLHMATFDPGEAFGTADVTYVRRGTLPPPPAPQDLSTVLAAQGALRLPDAPEPPAPDGWVADEVAQLTTFSSPVPGRWMLHPPVYEERFAAPAAAPPAAGWAGALHHDPRTRGTAGLGAWAAVAWQDRIADAAAVKAGDLAIARDRIGHLALGLEASRSMWRRRVPTDPARALEVLGCGLGRLPIEGGGTVLGALAGRTPLFARALWSSAARRALRPGPSRTSRAGEGAADFTAVLEVARRCPDPARDPAAEAVKRYEAIEEGRDLVDVLGTLHEIFGDGRDGCREVDIGALGAAVLGAVDPTVERPVVVDRVLGTLVGVPDIGPVEIEPELDLPLWSFLATTAPDWLLPGIGSLEPDEVVGLATNPGFVEAMLVGANTQAIGELEFRNLPLRSRWSPMRKFWQRRGGELDIEPIKAWPTASDFGGAGLQPPGLGAEAVVMFRTSLFRRYPGTVVYLMSGGAPDWDPPEEDEQFPLAGRIMPSFTGRVGDDVVFFGFPIAPSALATHWVVLEEPPTGYRFYLEDPAAPPRPGQQRRVRAVVETDFPNAATAPNAAEYGYDTFAVPVRVMIGELIEGGA